ncbi:unnamed protein product [Prorocentrum cordatum]|uniref:Uncharacterized protein n=1 Tax=Prorocentrum cordatum TaxID=2364126 RepID=A0ABN9T9I5_9DINO|nr:unnamed protein product [Polarella glacialis]
MLDTKVSPAGSADALFQECIGAIRNQRASLETDAVYQAVETGAITKLKQDELELTRRIFARIDPSQNLTSDLKHAGHDIDPYWSPFRKVDNLKEQVTAEFDEYSRYVSVAEQKRVRIQIKKSLKRCSQVYNPYSREFKNYHDRQASETPPVPFRLPDKHWEPTPLQVRLARERITWRDIDIIQHCLADNVDCSFTHPAPPDHDVPNQEAEGAGAGREAGAKDGPPAVLHQAAGLPVHAPDGSAAVDRGAADGPLDRRPGPPLAGDVAGDDGAPPGAGLPALPAARGPARGARCAAGRSLWSPRRAACCGRLGPRCRLLSALPSRAPRAGLPPAPPVLLCRSGFRPEAGGACNCGAG